MMKNFEQRLINYLVDNAVDYAAVGKTLAKLHPEMFLQLVEGELEAEMTAQKYANVLRELRTGRIVSAIKELRNMTGLGLKEAKDVVDVLTGRALRAGMNIGLDDAVRNTERVSNLPISEVAVMNARNEALLANLWAALRRY